MTILRVCGQVCANKSVRVSLQFPNADIAEEDFRIGIMPLELNRARLDPAAVAWIVVRSTLIRPVDDLNAVDPNGHPVSPGGNRQVIPFTVFRADVSGRLAIVYPARRGNPPHRIVKIPLARTVEDLALISIHRFAGNAAEEHAAVHTLPRRANRRVILELQDEIAVFPVGFQRAVAVCEADDPIDNACVGSPANRPTVQGFAVEERSHSFRPNGISSAIDLPGHDAEAQKVQGRFDHGTGEMQLAVIEQDESAPTEDADVVEGPEKAFLQVQFGHRHEPGENGHFVIVSAALRNGVNGQGDCESDCAKANERAGDSV